MSRTMDHAGAVLRTLDGVEPAAAEQATKGGPEPGAGHEHVLRAPGLTVADNAVRWAPGERLEHLVEASAVARRDALAVELPDGAPVSYAELDARADALARALVEAGLRAGDKVAILLGRSVDATVAILATLKAGGAYVPLDPSFPAERVAFICEDAGVTHAIARPDLAPAFEGTGAAILDPAEHRPSETGAAGRASIVGGLEPDPLAYIIYTSGTTGKPKGVPIRHSMIVNFCRVAAETYGYRSDDRVYQGLTIAFDFSVEEVLVPLCVGAALVPPAEDAGALVGQDLADFLRERAITAIACVPTVLATLDDELPALRFILVSGEACPADLVERWWTPERVFLNAYGPTETTVTCTITPLKPGEPVTIGHPLPTYAALILSPEGGVLAPGETGEIAIAGPGVAEGYLNRPERTAAAFVPDTLNLPDNPGGRLYRTGDLGRVDGEGRIEYLGRIDTQVKVRGYRIELAEIETALLRRPAIAQAAVDKIEPSPGQVELAGWYTLREGYEPPDHAEMAEQLRAELPSYMVPAFLERLDELPMLPSGKVDRKVLPAPVGPRLGASVKPYEAPASADEARVAAAFAGILGLERLSVADDLFDDLGMNSLLVARACARLRDDADGPPLALSMRDVYLARNVRELAARATPLGDAPAIVMPPPHIASDQAHVLCGLAQALTFLLYPVPFVWAFTVGVDWATDRETLAGVYARVMAFELPLLLAAIALPIAVKWTLIGRWRARTIDIWSADYFRFWLVRGLTRANPAVLFVGTPLYSLYLRALGAKIGRHARIFTSIVPIVTDLLTVGDRAVVSKDTVMLGARAIGGRIETGPITIGADAHVGDAAVIDVGATLGEGADLAHASSLAYGQSVGPGASVHGSPAVPAPGRFRFDGETPPSSMRDWLYVAYRVVSLLVLLPVPIVATVALYRVLPEAFTVSTGAGGSMAWHALEQAGWSLIAFAASLVIGLLWIMVVPRLWSLLLREGVEYPLHGLRHHAFAAVATQTNSRFFNTFFGDSSLIIHYLRMLGYRIDTSVQTGSNFGIMQKHDTPYLSRIGRGTLISDGLAQSQFEPGAGSFRLRETVVGNENFLGNSVVVPPGSRAGDNVLLATKALVPVHGELRENVGLLGSPPFEIPRSTKRDRAFDHFKEPDVLAERLRLKLRHNLATIGWFLVSRWAPLVPVFLLLPAIMDVDTSSLGTAFMLTALLLALYVAIIHFHALLEWTARRFRSHEPKACSIYDPYYWTHERYWKLADVELLKPLAGTPFTGWAWRLFGVRWGRKVYDGGTSMSERSLVSVGDHVTLDEFTMLQSHSLEDGAFKSDHVVLEPGVSVGTRGYVSYGTHLGENAVLAPDAFLVKGERIPAGAAWGGNPARAMGSQGTFGDG